MLREPKSSLAITAALCTRDVDFDAAIQSLPMFYGYQCLFQLYSLSSRIYIGKYTEPLF